MTAVEVHSDKKPPQRAEGMEVLPLGHLFEIALQKGPDGIAALEKLVELEARVSARNAAREFADALAAFQAECPLIPRTSTAQITSRKSGAKFSYKYAELDEIADTIREHLHARGFSYGWDCKMPSPGVLEVVCTLRHRNGHSQSATFTCTVDGSDSMSEPQKHASTLTFARRYSLVQVLGLTMTDPDPDGKQDPPADPEHVERLEEFLEVVNAEVPVDRMKFLAWLGVDTMAQLTQPQVERGMRELKVKLDRARGKK